jgi:hypothetical protein
MSSTLKSTLVLQYGNEENLLLYWTNWHDSQSILMTLERIFQGGFSQDWRVNFYKDDFTTLIIPDLEMGRSLREYKISHSTGEMYHLKIGSRARSGDYCFPLYANIHHWKNGTMPYSFTSNFPEKMKIMIIDAINNFQAYLTTTAPLTRFKLYLMPASISDHSGRLTFSYTNLADADLTAPFGAYGAYGSEIIVPPWVKKRHIDHALYHSIGLHSGSTYECSHHCTYRVQDGKLHTDIVASLVNSFTCLPECILYLVNSYRNTVIITSPETRSPCMVNHITSALADSDIENVLKEKIKDKRFHRKCQDSRNGWVCKDCKIFCCTSCKDECHATYKHKTRVYDYDYDYDVPCDCQQLGHTHPMRGNMNEDCILL